MPAARSLGRRSAAAWATIAARLDRTGPWRLAACGLGAALVLLLSADRITIARPGWAAGVINGLASVGLSPYRASPFVREALIPYSAVTVTDPTLPAGAHEVRTPGAAGTAWQSGLVYYRGAAQAATGTVPAAVKVFAQHLVTPPHQAVIAVGTSADWVQSNGHYYHFSRILNMVATAYDATWASNGPWTGEMSALGLPLDHGIVAVDPSVIPLGTRLYVQQYGLAIAADTGSAINGDRIDLFFWDTPHDIAAFGERHLKVYVLDDPKLPPIPSSPAARDASGKRG